MYHNFKHCVERERDMEISLKYNIVEEHISQLLHFQLPYFYKVSIL